MDFKDQRKDYAAGTLNRKDLNESPFDQFQHWMEDVLKANVIEPTAMTLATATREGKPSSRVVLMKHFDEDGLIFFTNYESRKARELDSNPVASVTFWWKELERQVIIEGKVERVSRQEDEAYFALRPRLSQISTWASRQDQPLQSREVLENEFVLFEKQFEGQAVPLPPYWGGFRLIPHAFEFWQGRRNRLHDRFSYTRERETWRIQRLSP